MSELRYKSRAMVEDLDVGECTIHRASGAHAARWWQLWFCVARETDGAKDVFCVPVNPHGPQIESGPGGRTWGMTLIPEPGGVLRDWQISPSINVLENGDAVHGASGGRSLWHQTPKIVGVEAPEAWGNGGAP